MQESSSSTSSDQLSDDIVLDAGPDVSEISPDEFLLKFLPKVPKAKGVVGDIISWIKNNPKHYANGRWKSFRMDPVAYKQTEPKVFARIYDIYNAIIDAVEHCKPDLEKQRTTEYISHPPQPPATVLRRDLTYPDTYFLFRNKQSRDKEMPHWMYIALIGEYKKKNTKRAVERNIKHILMKMSSIMQEDPRRRFAYGYTIENRDFRMWTATRSDIVVSEPVDFFTEPDYIIRFFFAFMYGSMEELGCDMSMKPIWNGDVKVQPKYDIIVHSKKNDKSPTIARTFRTIKLLSAIGAEAIRGRGTRVWTVNEVIDGKVIEDIFYVLKDAWVDSDREREGAVVEKIKQDAEKLKDLDERQDLLDCLLTTEAEGDVRLSDDTVDCTISGHKRTRLLMINRSGYSLMPHTSPTPSSLSVKAAKNAPTSGGRAKHAGDKHALSDHRDFPHAPETPEPVVYGAKTHYRIIFEEVCEVLHELPSLYSIVYTLWKVCAGLEILHKMNWVHRDISSGNIMLCGNVAKITDFEYAKKLTQPGEVDDMRTGTEDFMATEVRERSFMFKPKTGTVSLPRVNDHRGSTIEKPFAKQCGPIPVVSQPKATWFFNPLHDLESILWLLIYFTTNRDIVCETRGTPEPLETDEIEPFVFKEETFHEKSSRIQHHWQLAFDLFVGRSKRHSIMLSDSFLVDFLDLHPLHPAIAPLGHALIQLCEALASSYTAVEKNPSVFNFASIEKVYQTFLGSLRGMVGHLYRLHRHFDVQVCSLRTAYDALTNNSLSSTPPDVPKAPVKQKRVRNETKNALADGRPAKSPRTSQAQKSPSDPTFQPAPVIQATRVLRPRARKAVNQGTSAKAAAKLRPTKGR